MDCGGGMGCMCYVILGLMAEVWADEKSYSDVLCTFILCRFILFLMMFFVCHLI